MLKKEHLIYEYVIALQVEILFRGFVCVCPIAASSRQKEKIQAL